MKGLKYLFFILLAIFPLGQLGRVPQESGTSLQLNDILVGFLVGGWILYHLARRKKIISPPLARPILIFLFVVLLSFLLSFKIWGLNLEGSLYLLRWISYSGLYFVLYEAVSEKQISQDKILSLLIIVGTIVGVAGILQYIFYPDLRNLFYLGWDPHYYRLFSTFFDSAFTGIILVLTLILIIVRYVFDNKFISFNSFIKFKEKGLKWLVILPLISTYIGLSLTYARSAFVAFLSAIFVIAWLKKSPKFLLFTFSIFVLTLIILPKQEDRIASNLAREESSFARLVNWQQSLTIIRDHPIFGVGFNNYRLAQKQYGFLKEGEIVSHSASGADSSLLFVWATTGILGLTAYLWLGWKMVKIALRSWSSEKSVYGLSLFASITALFFHSLFANSLFYPWIMEWVWILAALVPIRENI